MTQVSSRHGDDASLPLPTNCKDTPEEMIAASLAELAINLKTLRDAMQTHHEQLGRFVVSVLPAANGGIAPQLTHF
jgi:hypothetical protein